MTHILPRDKRPRAFPVKRIETCACKRQVVQLADETEQEALERHQATPRHANWRFLRGL